ncbi:hypothetical protein AB1Y20_022414 [Prymnesium parvum]|uniref:Chromo domain-containing protein n=1 Tax=Prymnesium parvum TaxID=97485 RepID=A0AB34JIR9_PRYPA
MKRSRVRPPTRSGRAGLVSIMPPKRKERTWSVDKLIAHRWTPDGFEFKVKWNGCQRNGEPWEATWERVFDVGAPLVDSYFARLELLEAKVVPNVDISPLLQQAREKVAHTVAAARTKCRPRVHEINLEALTLQPLALAFLDMVRAPSKMYKWLVSTEEDLENPEEPAQLEVHHFVDSDGVQTWQVNYTKMQDVAAFCSFHSFGMP